MAEQKIWWGPMAEQKMVGPLSHWVAEGTPSASAKRSAEQKCGIKIGGIKTGRTKIGRIKIWWGTLGYWVAGTPRVSAKRSAEQKCRIKIGGIKIGGIKIGGTKIGENKNLVGDPRLLGGGDP